MSLLARLGVRLGSLHLDVGLSASDGSVLAVLGPNGAGKTTVLRALAGLQPLDHGRIEVAGRPVDDPEADTFVPPEDRGVGFVHQDLLLFPHLSVLDNVAFGPRSRGATKIDSRATAGTWLERMGLDRYADSKPGVLSGGQAQRVAMARALAGEPDVLLLDEPLSALDLGVRGDVRRDLRRQLDHFEGVTVVVTHDPLDALTLADHVLVLEDGRATQSGSIGEVSARPRTRYVADLMGTNLLRGDARRHTVTLDGDAILTIAESFDGPVFATVSPSAVTLHVERPSGSARNCWPGTVTVVELLGERVRLHLDGPVPVVAEITPVSLAELGLQVGHQVWATVKATEVAVYPR